MSGFLAEMAASSAERSARAQRVESRAALERRARQTPPPPPLRLSGEGFDVIAELKLRSPAAGVLEDASHDWLERVERYARAGAAAVSVLTEPSRFDGSLEHLQRAVRVLTPLGVPAMRKDFLVDSYQVIEARCAGAGGVLVILRLLPRELIAELLATAAEQGLFVLLEAFDARDLEAAGELLARIRPSQRVLVGVNCRDLATLEIRPERFAELASLLPPGSIGVAESGVAGSEDAVRMRALGYRLALIGTALMTHDEPGRLLAEILRSARTVQR